MGQANSTSTGLCMTVMSISGSRVLSGIGFNPFVPYSENNMLFGVRQAVSAWFLPSFNLGFDVDNLDWGMLVRHVVQEFADFGVDDFLTGNFSAVFLESV